MDVSGKCELILNVIVAYFLILDKTIETFISHFLTNDIESFEKYFKFNFELKLVCLKKYKFKSQHKNK